jgi:hypothetical protein
MSYYLAGDLDRLLAHRDRVRRIKLVLAVPIILDLLDVGRRLEFNLNNRVRPVFPGASPLYKVIGLPPLSSPIGSMLNR